MSMKKKDVLKVEEIHYYRFSISLNKKQKAKLYYRSPRGILCNYDKVFDRLINAKFFDIKFDNNMNKIHFSIKTSYYGEAMVRARDVMTRILKYLSRA